MRSVRRIGLEALFWSDEYQRVQFLQRLPVEIKWKILQSLDQNRTSIFTVTCLSYRAKTKNDLRFEEICRRNDVKARFGRHTPWLYEFKNLIATLKDQLLSGSFPIVDGAGLENEINGRPLDYIDLSVRQEQLSRLRGGRIECTVHFTTNQRMPSNLKILSRRFVIEHDYFTSYIVLGNLHDLTVQQDEKINCVRNEILLDTPILLACDDHHNLYSCQHFDDRIVIKWGNLLNSATPVSERISGCAPGFRIPKIVRIAAGHFKLFIVFETRVLQCYRLKTAGNFPIMCETHIPDMDLRESMFAHNGSVVLGAEGGGTLLYSYAGQGFVRKCIPSFRRYVFNRYSYLILSENVYGQARLEILSIFDEFHTMIFVQHCERDCIVRRLNNNFFCVLETDKRCLWFQETPASRPCLVHVIKRPTFHRSSQDRLVSWRRKRRHSTGGLLINVKSQEFSAIRNSPFI